MKYLYVGSHPDFLASGRPVTFGDILDADELDQVGDAHLAPSLVDAPDAPAPASPPAAPAAKSEATAPESTTTEAK